MHVGADRAVVVDIGDALAKLDAADRLLGGTVDLYREIAGMLESTTRANFEAQGRPAWVPLAKSTEREKLKRNKGSSVLKILQDRGTLAGSISADFGGGPRAHWCRHTIRGYSSVRRNRYPSGT
ncbi:phage virion morphogenesis protein [Burkholderia sp. AU16741]|uniref:phage virion morphogenesis protein n=1 Tax=Burkholderia sp. AU16741 TaxID=2015347 RepID=UPI00359C8ED6